MRKSILQIFLLFALLLECFSKRYVEMVYSEVVAKMTELSQKYPRYSKLFDVRNEYDHLIDTYCGRDLCKHWYLQITDFNLPAEKINTLPQVLFLGGIHGDEVLGPNIVINLAEHLLQKNEESEDITRLIKSRVIILLPMANPSGFDAKRREERQGSNIYLDPNRDFPYNIRDSQCLRTSCARVINFLFKKYLLQAAITFHGGQQVISYPWGAFNHIKGSTEGKHQLAEEAPDNKAFEDVANILSTEGGSNLYLSLKPYPTGKMTDTVYAVDGGMEDWAYGASWETKYSPDVISRCEKSSDTVPIAPEDTIYNSQSVRSMIYLIETSNSKQPATTFLGSSDGLDSNQDKYAYGHIPINIRICLALADLLEPYVKLKEMEYIEERNILTIQWQGGGCKHVDSTSIEWTFKNGSSSSTSQSDAKQGPGYYENREQVYEQVIDLSNQNFSVSLLIKLTCDQNWGSQVDPKPAIGPQTHMVQSRVNQSYYAESNGYKVTGKKVVELKIDGLTKESLLKTRIKDIKELALAIDFAECSTFSRVGTINMQLNNTMNITALGIRGTLDVEDPFLEGHLHQYGDTSRCVDSAGSTISYEDLKTATEYEDSRLFTMQKDQIKTVKIDYTLALEKEEDVVNLIGKSVILEKKGHPDKIFIGQIVPVQPNSCKKANEMRNCIGTDIGSRSGVCILNMMLEETMRNFKLFIEPNSDKRTVTIQGFIPTTIIDRFNKFDELLIMNEKTEKKFSIKQKVGGYGLIEPSTFNLYPQIALGSLLRVYVQASGERLLLGDCSIGLKDSQFNETAFIYEKITLQQQEKAFALRNQLLLFLLICVLLVIIGLVLFFVLKRYKRLKKQNFDVAMTERKERYADTARMISTARGIATARGVPSGASTVRDTARSGFSLFGNRGNYSARERRGHMELQENSMEETSR